MRLCDIARNEILFCSSMLSYFNYFVLTISRGIVIFVDDLWYISIMHWASDRRSVNGSENSMG